MSAHFGEDAGRARRICALAALSLLIAGCAHKPKPADEPVEASPDSRQAAGVFRVVPNGEVANAAMQPLADVGLKRDKIPPTLKGIKTPYAAGIAPTCESIAEEILALDVVLGDDVDVKLADQTWRQKGTAAANDAFIDAVESTSTSVIPFRGVVREVSGAAQRDRRMAAAVQAGKLRRAFLKGIGHARGCEPPAAPIPYVEK